MSAKAHSNKRLRQSVGYAVRPLDQVNLNKFEWVTVLPSELVSLVHRCVM